MGFAAERARPVHWGRRRRPIKLCVSAAWPASLPHPVLQDACNVRPVTLPRWMNRICVPIVNLELRTAKLVARRLRNVKPVTKDLCFVPCLMKRLRQWKWSVKCATKKKLCSSMVSAYFAVVVSISRITNVLHARQVNIWVTLEISVMGVNPAIHMR